VQGERFLYGGFKCNSVVLKVCRHY
jgi:hypothetical protein